MNGSHVASVESVPINMTLDIIDNYIVIFSAKQNRLLGIIQLFKYLNRSVNIQILQNYNFYTICNIQIIYSIELFEFEYTLHH